MPYIAERNEAENCRQRRRPCPLQFRALPCRLNLRAGQHSMSCMIASTFADLRKIKKRKTSSLGLKLLQVRTSIVIVKRATLCSFNNSIQLFDHLDSSLMHKDYGDVHKHSFLWKDSQYRQLLYKLFDFVITTINHQRKKTETQQAWLTPVCCLGDCGPHSDLAMVTYILAS